jgi:membrane protein required for colicin V production
MNLLDYIIIILMTFLIVRGILRGLIKEIFSLAGIVLGIWLAILFQPQATDFLRSYLPDGKYLPLLSIAALFAAIFISSNIIGWTVKLLFEKAFLGWLDRALGACLAVAKGIVITYIAIVILTFFVPAKTPLIAGSTLAPWIIRSYQSMVNLISPDHYRDWKKKILGEKNKVGAIVNDKLKDKVKNNE